VLPSASIAGPEREWKFAKQKGKMDAVWDKIEIGVCRKLTLQQTKERNREAKFSDSRDHGSGHCDGRGGARSTGK